MLELSCSRSKMISVPSGENVEIADHEVSMADR